MAENQEILKLKKEIDKLKKSIKKQRYGLVWMDVPEAFEDDVENKIPVLKDVPELAIKNNDGKPQHILIEGDNYHALTCLNYTHKGKIDVIYIDPPYNTGSDGFRYKDKRIISKFPDGTEVPKDHPFRHSYWLSFMKKRLELARELLSDEGVMFISINDIELGNLKLICNEIFDEDNVEVMIWYKIPEEGTAGQGKMKITHRFRIDHEYIMVCYKNKNNTKFNKPLRIRKVKNVYDNLDNDPRGDWMSCEICKSEKKSNPKGKNFYTIKTPKGREIKRQWHINQKEFFELDKDKRIYWGSGNTVPRLKKFLNEPKQLTPSSLLPIVSQTEGNYDLNEIFGKEKVFDNPKPVKLISWLIEIASREDSTILDFFAGSGTTTHATLKINEMDKLKRRTILCTNNEEKICTDVCYPRIKKVINGFKGRITGEKYAPLGNSLKYYKTAFIGKNNILDATDEDKIELAQNAGELLAIAENTLELVKQDKYTQLFEDNLKKKYTAVYFREELDKFDKFVEKVQKLDRETTVYMFSWGNDEFIDEFEGNKNIKVKTIPAPILEIYKNIYNLNN